MQAAPAAPFDTFHRAQHPVILARRRLVRFAPGRGALAAAGALRLALAGALWACLRAAAAAQGETAPEAARFAAPLRAALENFQAEAENSPGLSEEARAQQLETCRTALRELETAEQLQQRAAELRAQRLAAPLRQLQLKQDLAALARQPAAAVRGSLAELEARWQTLAERSASLHAELDRWEAEPGRRAEWRRSEYPAAAEEVAAELAKLPPAEEADDPPSSPAAAALAAQRLRASARQAALEAERQYYETTAGLAALERDLAARQSERADAELQLVEQRVLQLRRAESEREQLAASRVALDAHPALRSLADEAIALAQQRAALTERLAEVAQERGLLAAESEELAGRWSRLQAKVAAAGLTNAVGQLLRQQRPDPAVLARHRQEVKLRQEDISQVQLALLDLEDRRAALARDDALVERTLQSVPAAQRAALEEPVRELLASQRRSLETLIAEHQQWFDELLELDVKQRQLVAQMEDLARFVNERVLWIRSHGPFSLRGLPAATVAAESLFSPTTWLAAGRALFADAAHEPWAGCAVLVLWGLLIGRRRFRQRLERVGEQAQRDYVARLGPTLAAAGWTLLLAVPGPALLELFAQRLLRSAVAPPDVLPLAWGLHAAAVAWFPLELFLHLCRRHGLGAAHFGWPAEALGHWRRDLRLLSPVVVPLVWWIAALEQFTDPLPAGVLGRLGFAGVMLALCWMSARNFRAERWPFPPPESDAVLLWQRLPALCYPLLVAAPLGFLALALAGYYYTALVLSWRLMQSLCLVVCCVLVHSFLLRWVLVARRAIAIASARARVQAAQAGAAAAAPPDAGLSTADLTRINLQTRRLLRTVLGCTLLLGGWYIWADILPAARVLDRWVLWNPGQSAAPAAAAPQASDLSPGQTPGSQAADAVTAADALLALVLVLLTFAAAGNLPGVLEIALPRVVREPGSRYAVVTLARYAITLLGLILAFQAIGVGWHNVQWLAAAISLGLGFGLQEVFANFVCGIILLFERPIRVGDVVTVGGTSGAVSRIRMRATTIVDADRKELVIPNRAFITGEVVNWTLTDPLVRLVIPVGVAYGSDPRLVTHTLLDVARDCPLLVAEPPPEVVCLKFGESSLDFELRVFVPEVARLIPARHALHVAIYEAFARAQLEIAYPQRVVVLRTEPGADLPGIPRETPPAP